MADPGSIPCTPDSLLSFASSDQWIQRAWSLFWVQLGVAPRKYNPLKMLWFLETSLFLHAALPWSIRLAVLYFRVSLEILGWGLLRGCGSCGGMDLWTFSSLLLLCWHSPMFRAWVSAIFPSFPMFCDCVNPFFLPDWVTFPSSFAPLSSLTFHHKDALFFPHMF